MASKKLVSNLFIALLIFLPLQYAIVGIVGVINREPWPALVFPGFKSVYVYESGFIIEEYRFEVYSQQADSIIVASYPPYEFFPELPKSQLSGFLSSHFGSPELISAFSEKTITWIGERASEISEGTPYRVEVVSGKLYFKSSSQTVRPDSSSENFRAAIPITE